MAPFDPNSMAAMLGLTQGMQQGQQAQMPKQEGPLGSGMYQTMGEQANAGIADSVLGKVPGMANVPEANAPNPLLGPAADKIPGVEAPGVKHMAAPAPATAPASGGMQPQQAALGLEAMRMLSQMGQEPQMSAPGASVAPRGNQVQLDAMQKMVPQQQFDPRMYSGMAAAVYGGGR